jgi:RimJ/RimL family protein N-acetyltransferase
VKELLIKDGELSIRSAVAKDAPLLGEWWRDGEIMAHAGFPDGLDITDEEITQNLALNDDLFVLIIEAGGVAVGEMNYKDYGEIAGIGIKICDSALHGKGYGVRFVNMLIGELFGRGYQKIIVDADLENIRAQKTYEKVGFVQVARHENSWTDQMGQSRGHIDYELTRADWRKSC